MSTHQPAFDRKLTFDKLTDAFITILAGAHGPALHDLQRIGVARVSFGPGPLGVALAALRDTAVKLLSGGSPPETLGYRPPTG